MIRIIELGSATVGALCFSTVRLHDRTHRKDPDRIMVAKRLTK